MICYCSAKFDFKKWQNLHTLNCLRKNAGLTDAEELPTEKELKMSLPIIIFNPEGLTKEQIKLIKQALDDAYRAGYETAKEFYQLKLNTLPSQNQGHTWITAPNPNTYEINNCSHGVEQGIYSTSSNEGLPGPTVSKGRGR